MNSILSQARQRRERLAAEWHAQSVAALHKSVMKMQTALELQVCPMHVSRTSEFMHSFHRWKPPYKSVRQQVSLSLLQYMHQYRKTWRTRNLPGLIICRQQQTASVATNRRTLRRFSNCRRCQQPRSGCAMLFWSASSHYTQAT